MVFNQGRWNGGKGQGLQIYMLNGLVSLQEEGTGMPQHTWCCERTTSKSWFSFHHVGPRDGTQVLKLGGKCLYPLSHLADPSTIVFRDSWHVCFGNWLLREQVNHQWKKKSLFGILKCVQKLKRDHE